MHLAVQEHKEVMAVMSHLVECNIIPPEPR